MSRREEVGLLLIFTSQSFSLSYLVHRVILTFTFGEEDLYKWLPAPSLVFWGLALDATHPLRSLPQDSPSPADLGPPANRWGAKFGLAAGCCRKLR